METILCPIDFSLWSENAVKYAFELAQLMRARLILFHSKPASLLPVAAQGLPDTFPYTDEEEDLEIKLAELKQKLENSNPESTVIIQTRQPEGQESTILPALIEQEKIGLVILGYADNGELQDAAPDAGVVNIVMKATCPVLLIPQQVTFKPLWKIVYATDLKSEPAADCASLLRLAHLFNAEIMLLHVLKKDVVGTRELATEELQKVYSNLPYRNVSYYLEANESVDEGISQFVEQNNADLLVLCSHPKKVWKHLLPGHHHRKAGFQTALPMLIRHPPAL